MTPFLRWAGGKRWLVAEHPEWLKRDCRKYIEPFLGSGAVFFTIEPATAVLNDINSELIETYRAITEYPDQVARYLKAHERWHCDEYYYLVRSQRLRSAARKAARFVYLNRTCFNGLYRVNRQGLFNVPKGTKEAVVLPTDDFQGVADLVRNATLRAGDFEEIVDRAREGDFIYIDPPYTVRHNNNGFLRYNEQIFSWHDQKRLAESAFRAARRGAAVLLSNANHNTVRQLYRHPIWQRITLKRKSVMASHNTSRTNCAELVVSNYLDPMGRVVETRCE